MCDTARTLSVTSLILSFSTFIWVWQHLYRLWQPIYEYGFGLINVSSLIYDYESFILSVSTFIWVWQSLYWMWLLICVFDVSVTQFYECFLAFMSIVTLTLSVTTLYWVWARFYWVLVRLFECDIYMSVAIRLYECDYAIYHCDDAYMSGWLAYDSWCNKNKNIWGNKINFTKSPHSKLPKTQIFQQHFKKNS